MIIAHQNSEFLHKWTSLKQEILVNIHEVVDHLQQMCSICYQRLYTTNPL